MGNDDGRMTLQLRQRLPSAARITGRLINGDPVTLLGTGLTRFDPAQHYVEEHVVSTAVVGLELLGVDDPCLAGATVRMGGLEQAIGKSGLSLTAPGTLAATSVRVSWEPLEPIEVPLPEATLRLTSYAHFDHESSFRFALEHDAQARVHADGQLSLRQVERYFNVLATFIAFATEGQVGTRQLKIMSGTDDRASSTVADVFTRERMRYGPMPDAMRPWLTLEHLDEPAAAVAGFYRFAEQQPAAFLILHEFLVFASELNPIDKLLYLARFLEVYHRTRFPGERDPQELHAKRVALVKAATDAEHREWGAHLLHHSNDIFFKDRVRRLVAGPAAAAESVLGGPPEQFAKVVGDSRNYWTHYADDLEAKALRDVALDDLDDRLLLVVRACVLDAMGLQTSAVHTCLARDWRFEQCQVESS